MEKVSVIIPTIQKKLKVLHKLIGLLQEDSSVTEIILINNLLNIPLTFENSDKLNIITPDQNLYVNASWNYGVSIAKNENFVLINDDMLPCRNFCKAVVNSEVFNSPSTGYIGMGILNIQQYRNVEDIEIPDYIISNIPQFLEMKRYLNIGDWGISIFGKKSCWEDIPSDLKILYGDNYILRSKMQEGKKNYEIVNLPVNHIHSSSSASDVVMTEIIEDLQIHLKYFPEDTLYKSLVNG